LLESVIDAFALVAGVAMSAESAASCFADSDLVLMR
jgi:hypothetical protein